MRTAGILLPVFSLAGDYGIGCFSKKAYEFIDFLEKAGQTYWQMLPLGPTSYGDSPYQSYSTFAGNPYFIDLQVLIDQGYLTEKQVKKADLGLKKNDIDYAKLYKNRMALLESAYRRHGSTEEAEIQAFCEENAFWIYDYALFMSVKHHFDDGSFTLWPEDIRLRKKEAMKKYQELLQDSCDFYIWIQYEFYKQWNQLRDYAKAHGVKIIGDLPIYVSPDSSDVWAEPDLFQLDKNRRPVLVAGCPPDGFAPEGQLWGNPVYDWAYHEKTEFAWWKKRMEMATKLYDVIRIDHFRGLDEYYGIPAGAKNAINGEWLPGPGMKLIRALKPVLKAANAGIIAEDLGFITNSVRKLVRDSKYPNMKVAEFAFDSRDTGDSNDYLPFNYDKNSICYTGTHDNETLLGWYMGQDAKTRRYVQDFVDVHSRDAFKVCKAVIRMCIASPADTCVIPLQDYLGLGNEARINVPSTLGENWRWRMSDGVLTEELAEEILKVTKLYGRYHR